MGRIKGLNDLDTLQKKPPVAAIKIWKGDKKGKDSRGRLQAGSSLDDRFRIEAPLKLRQVIKKAYSATESDGSLYVDRLNIIPAYENEFKAFDSKMAAYTASSPVLFCDRETIHTRFVQEKDPYGSIYFNPKQTSEPCPVAGTNFECPNKCSRTGDFYFYIYELVLQGYAEFARLQVHGVADNQNIASALDEVKASIGAIKNSPFVSDLTRTYIVYEMTRRSSQYKYPIKEGGVRTAKRGTKEEWIISLNLHPIWLNKYNSHVSHQKLLAANITPSIKLIEQIHDRALIGHVLTAEGGERVTGDSEISQNQQIRASSPSTASVKDADSKKITPWQMNDIHFKELSGIWQTHNWHKNAIAQLLFSYFGIQDRAGIMAISLTEFERLKHVSADTKVKQELGVE